MSPNVKNLVAAGAMLALSVAVLGQEQKPQVIMGLQKPPKVNFASPLPPGPMAEVAATACTECHEPRIILQQRLSKEAWTKEVDKMIKWGALVDTGAHDPLIDYLTSNFGVDQPPYEPSRTSTEKNIAAKSK
jgi:hypothetical protein